MPKDVYAFTRSRNPRLAEAKNTHRQCAERILLGRWIAEAWRHGVKRPEDALVWMKRKSGGLMRIVRPIKIKINAEGEERGEEGCSAPCVFCSRALLEGGVRAEFVARSGSVYRGELSSCGESPVLSGAYKRYIR